MKKNKKGIIITISIIILLIISALIIYKFTRKEEPFEVRYMKMLESKEIPKQNLVNKEVKEIEGAEYIEETEDGAKNISSKLKEEKQIGELIIRNISIIYKNGISTIQAEILNKSNEKLEEGVIYLKILDNNGEEVRKIPYYTKAINEGEIEKLEVKITSDISNAYDIIFDKE